MKKSLYFRGQGELKAALIDTTTGSAVAFRKLGEVDMLELQPTVEVIEHVENQTGKDFTDLRFYHTPRLGFRFQAKNLDMENFAMGMWGTKGTIDAGEAVSATFTAVEAGVDYEFGVPGSTVASVTKDAVALPVNAFTVNADGTITFAADHTGEIVVTGTTVAGEFINLMNAGNYEVALIFNGLNTIDGKRVVIKIGRATTTPAQNISLISKELTSIEIQGSALYDPTAPQVGLLAGYGSMTFIGA